MKGGFLTVEIVYSDYFFELPIRLTATFAIPAQTRNMPSISNAVFIFHTPSI